MATLLDLGQIVSLAEASAKFEQLVLARELFDPKPFCAWANHIRVDEPDGQALLLPAGTVVPGDLELDYDNEDVEAHRIGTVLALGDLTVEGRLVNLDGDGGPFLLTGGSLRAREIFKGGASIVTLGSIISDGTLFCNYNHGTMQVCGDVTAPLVLLNDHEILVTGTVNGRVVRSETCDLREVLVSEVFFDADDEDDEWPDGGLILERLLAGLPVIKPGA